jgi:hypothetical protein
LAYLGGLSDLVVPGIEDPNCQAAKIFKNINDAPDD